MQQDEQFIEHRGKKYILKRISIKDFINLKNFVEHNIDTINLMKINTEDELAEACAKWLEFMDRAFMNTDEDIQLDRLTRKEMSDIERDFFLVYWGADPKNFSTMLKHLENLTPSSTK